MYRSTEEDIAVDNARNILAVLPAARTVYVDEAPVNNIHYYYTVTTIDKGHNESGRSFSQYPAEVHSTPPVRHSLSQNYPNPFSDKTYISYELSEKSPVELIVQDTLTKKEITLVRETQEAGTYIVSVDAKSLPRGKYLYRLRAGSFVAMKYLERGE